MTVSRCLFIACLSLSLVFGGSVLVASADEVLDSIQEAINQYKKGEFSSAAGSLDYAAQLIRQKKGNQLQDVFPKPLAGWTAEDATSEAVGGAMFGGGVTAERRYTKEPGSVTIKLVTDSPLLQGMMMMMANPAMATSDGGKLETINNQKAIVKYFPAESRGEITIAFDNRFLITVEGDSVKKEDLTAYVKAIDFGKLKAMQ